MEYGCLSEMKKSSEIALAEVGYWLEVGVKGRESISSSMDYEKMTLNQQEFGKEDTLMEGWKTCSIWEVLCVRYLGGAQTQIPGWYLEIWLEPLEW